MPHVNWWLYFTFLAPQEMTAAQPRLAQQGTEGRRRMAPVKSQLR